MKLGHQGRRDVRGVLVLALAACGTSSGDGDDDDGTGPVAAGRLHRS